MKSWPSIAGAALLVALLAAACNSGSKPAAPVSDAQPDAPAKRYHCPMHPTYISDRPGTCPICGMNLVPVDGSGTDSSATAVEGRTTIAITPDWRAKIGVTTVVAERQTMNREIRATATLAYPEDRIVQVSPRFGGWVKEVYVDSAGRAVKAGDPLFKLYSPELRSTQQEFLDALASGSAAIKEAPRRRLALFGLDNDEIAQIEKSGSASDSVVIRAPATGVIRTKRAFAGMSFATGEMLFEIADASRMWAVLKVAEQDLPLIKIGQEVHLAVSALPNHLFEAEVDYVSPALDEMTRRADVRVALDNQDGSLRADMWATASLSVPLPESVTIPASAALDTGRRTLVFVDRDDGHLEPRAIRAGARAGDFIQVRSGLEAGERVVTRALFLVDSESQMKAAIAGMIE